MNASHGTPELRAGWIAEVRRAADAADVAVAVLVDLQGPRIRVGKLSQPRVLRPGETVVFAPEDMARGDELPTTYADLAADVRPGARVLLDDGLLSLEVTRVAAPRVEGRVVDGGTLTANKGMNLPGLHVSAPALTEKDREDAAHAVAAGADFLALSFVRRAEDMGALRALVPPEVKLVAKIEKATALEDLPRILEASDAVMVARGDLGVELPFEEVPAVQKRLIREANRFGKPVITATQMLESMVHNPRPTRAEASDVANAILDGTDAVMLSAETAVGKYPYEAVRAMDRIIREMERQAPPLGGGEPGRAPARARGNGFCRGRDRDRHERGGAHAPHAAHRDAHQGRLHVAQGVGAPHAGADPRRDHGTDHLSPARSRVGRDPGRGRSGAGVRRDAGGGAGLDSEARVRARRRSHRDDGGRAVGGLRGHQPPQGRGRVR